MTLDAVGGVWRYAADLAVALQRVGIECLLVGSGPAPSQQQRAECASSGIELAWIDRKLDWLAADEDEVVAVSGQIARMTWHWRADLVHLNLPSEAAGLPQGLPVVVASHSCVATWWDAMRSGELPEAWQWRQRRHRAGFDRADVVLAPSRSHADALRRAYGAIGRLEVVHNATTPPSTIGPKTHMVLSAGRWWDEGKNGRVLDEAAAHSPWPVVMAGALVGPDGQRIELEHAASPAELPADAMRIMMQRAAIFAAPSRYEPFGLAVLEAAASGAALVLSDIPTFHELWTDAALLVDPGNPAAWVDAIRTLARDEPLRAHLAARARSRAGQFSSERQLDGILRSYETAMQVHHLAETLVA